MTTHNPTSGYSVDALNLLPPYSSRPLPDDLTPTAAELDAIDTEWPLIAAEIAVVDAEIAILSAPNGPGELDWRRLRHAQHRVLRQAVALTASIKAQPTPRQAA